MSRGLTRYQRLARVLERQIRRGVYAPGERLPGVRRLAAQFQVSVATALSGVETLERQGLIEARPRSGFYVREASPVTSRSPPPRTVPTLVSGQERVLRLVQAAHSPGVLDLGTAIPHGDFYPLEMVNRCLRRCSRDAHDGYRFPPGDPTLRRQLARRLLTLGCEVDPEDIIITSGCQEAMTLALRALTRPGDVVAIESPSYYGLLQALESLELRALEIPSDPLQGIELPALEAALANWPVRACALVSHFSNPLGSCPDDVHQRALMALLERHGIPLVENDIYGELYHQGRRPAPLKSLEGNTPVLYCGSVAKTLSPGLRVGWVVNTQYRERLSYLKYVTNLSTPALAQRGVAQILEEGRDHRPLQQVRRRYREQLAWVTEQVQRCFPSGTRMSRPQGGFVLWVELPQGDALSLARQALTQGISIAPGPVFSASGGYRRCLRLNCAQPVDDTLAAGLKTLGALAVAEFDRSG